MLRLFKKNETPNNINSRLQVDIDNAIGYLKYKAFESFVERSRELVKSSTDPVATAIIAKRLLRMEVKGGVKFNDNLDLFKHPEKLKALAIITDALYRADELRFFEAPHALNQALLDGLKSELHQNLFTPNMYTEVWSNWEVPVDSNRLFSWEGTSFNQKILEKIMSCFSMSEQDRINDIKGFLTNPLHEQQKLALNYLRFHAEGFTTEVNVDLIRRSQEPIYTAFILKRLVRKERLRGSDIKLENNLDLFLKPNKIKPLAIILNYLYLIDEGTSSNDLNQEVLDKLKSEPFAWLYSEEMQTKYWNSWSVEQSLTKFLELKTTIKNYYIDFDKITELSNANMTDEERVNSYIQFIINPSFEGGDYTLKM